MEPNSKQSWKWIEPPLNTIKDLLLHHSSNLRKQKNAIIKEQRLNNWHAINQEQINASRTVKQLNATLKDLREIEAKVQRHDVDKFKRSIADIKKDALNVLKEYQDLENKIKLVKENETSKSDDERKRMEDEEEAMNELSRQMLEIKQDNEQIQMVAAEMERLENNIHEVNEIFTDLAQIVHAQGETVSTIEDNIETAHENVIAGESQLAKAAKYKAGMYPLIGAVAGICVGGPIGALAGFKMGSVAAVTGTIIGFTGGKMVKDKQGESISDQTPQSVSLPDPVHV
ncbi:hypothetical protein M8J76_012150 [Diaphorina citri]|nr:hypothetical protein M8J76_012150 [Diaphorina citri]